MVEILQNFVALSEYINFAVKNDSLRNVFCQKQTNKRRELHNHYYHTEHQGKKQ